MMMSYPGLLATLGLAILAGCTGKLAPVMIATVTSPSRSSAPTEPALTAAPDTRTESNDPQEAKRSLARSEARKYAALLKKFSQEHGTEYFPLGYPALKGDLSVLVEKGYLPDLPKDPWGGSYAYVIVRHPLNAVAFEPVVYCDTPTKKRIDSQTR